MNDRTRTAERHHRTDHRIGDPGHRTLGPGLLESAYAACLAFELEKHGLRVEEQKPMPLVYEDVKLECGYRADLIVENLVVVEVKSVEALAPIHEAQVLS